MNLSKSKYCSGIVCDKKVWLSCYKPEEAEDMGSDTVLENGTRVGELARDLFGEHILIEYNKDKQKMVEDTKKYLKESPNIICEASFIYDDNFCAVDILKNYKDGVEIYEVKSSTDIDDIYLDDISYQTWVLKKCGLNVKKSFIVYVNNKYVKNGDFNINEFFNIEDVSDSLDLESVEKNINELKEIINNDKEPDVDLSLNCKKNKKTSYDCPFFKYCSRNLPTPNVFDIGWGMHFSKKLEMYQRGHITFEDVIDKEKLSAKTIEQVRFALNDNPPKINKEAIKKLIDSFKYPLYFLDFESYQPAIPTIDGTHPYQQICFQYSLHILDKDNNLIHKEFLSDDYNGNPMYGLCKQLCEDIPANSCILVYNKTFEQTRLREMAEIFPEFREHLLNIRDNIIDLMDPFFNQDYYVKEMGDSYSIKKVLPALFPNDPSLDYHNLEQVHKGDEASNAYQSLPTLSEQEQIKLRKNMLKYCELDTYAMVKIYEKLMEIK